MNKKFNGSKQSWGELIDGDFLRLITATYKESAPIKVEKLVGDEFKVTVTREQNTLTVKIKKDDTILAKVSEYIPTFKHNMTDFWKKVLDSANLYSPVIMKMSIT